VSLLPFLMAFAVGGASAAEVLTLEAAVAEALKNQPLAAEAHAAADGARARSGQASAAYYPQISVAADWTKSRAYYPILGAGAAKEAEVNSAAVYLKQTLYDFGRTSGAAKAARHNHAAAEQACASARQDIVFRVKTAYYLALAAEKQVAADSETVKAREEVYRQAHAFFAEGVRPKIDSSRAESNLYAAKTALVRAENNRDLARLELASAMGREEDLRALAEPEAALAELPAREALHHQALAQRAEMKRLEELIYNIDPDAFTIMGSGFHVLGQGFSKRKVY
jgi:outer membrane protein TolC